MALWAALAHKKEIEWNDPRDKDKQSLVFGVGEDLEGRKRLIEQIKTGGVCYLYGRRAIHFWDRPGAVTTGTDEFVIPGFLYYAERQTLHPVALRHVTGRGSTHVE